MSVGEFSLFFFFFFFLLFVLMFVSSPEGFDSPMKPFTDIHSPLANATRAREMTKLGNSEVNKTTRLSAAKRSRKTHMTHTKKACAVGWKLLSQYEMAEKEMAMRTVFVCF